jgi:hypothetical protein
MPLITNDGPIHMSFGHFLNIHSQSYWVLSNSLYEINSTSSPNYLIYAILQILYKYFSVSISESIIQMLCIFGFIFSGYYLLKQINPEKTWLAIFLYPISLHQMFFLGTYNFSLSLAGFFLVLAFYFKLEKSPSWQTFWILVVCLYITYFTHAAGFLASIVALSFYLGTKIVLGVNRMALVDLVRSRKLQFMALLL